MISLISSLPITEYDGDSWYLSINGEGDYLSYGQSFLAVSNYTILSSAKFYFKKYAGSTGSLSARIYATTGTHGVNAIPTGSFLAESDLIAVADVSDSDLTLYTFTFSGLNKLQLTPGTVYVMALYYYNESVDNSITVAFGYGTVYHDGNCCKLLDTTWTEGDPYNGDELELIFYVYAETPPESSVEWILYDTDLTTVEHILRAA